MRALSSLEQEAIEAGEIDAIIDRASSNVILLPAARLALGKAVEAAARALPANKLLAELPRAECQRVLAGLEAVTLKFGQVLQEPGAPILQVYFPIDCVVSLLVKLESFHALEVGLVGYEGMVGIALPLGIGVSSVRALVQAPGTALRMSAVLFHAACRDSADLRSVLYRYADAKLAQARQTVACNTFHTVEARLARYLLMTADRARVKEFALTQVHLAAMLGVRRASVNEAACPLRERGLISYRHGTIRILDPRGLEEIACGCYSRIESASRSA